MPFVSRAQRRKFYSTPSLRKYIPEFEAATPPGPLPPRVGQPQPKHNKPSPAKRDTGSPLARLLTRRHA